MMLINQDDSEIENCPLNDYNFSEFDENKIQLNYVYSNYSSKILKLSFQNSNNLYRNALDCSFA